MNKYKRASLVFTKFSLIVSVLLSNPTITGAKNGSSEQAPMAKEQNIIGDSKVKKDRSNELIVKFKESSKSGSTKSNILKKYPQAEFKSKNIASEKGSSKARMLVSPSKSEDSDKILEELRKDPNVLYVQKNYQLELADISAGQISNAQWPLLNQGQEILGQKGHPGVDIGALNAWNITSGDPNVVVGVLDTGIDTQHFGLRNSIYINTKEIPNNGIDDDNNGYVDDVSGYDFSNGDSSVFDNASSDAHGTHIAGIIASNFNQEGIVGIAPNAKILPLKFIDGNVGYTSDAIEAIEYAKKMGVKIINMSW